MKLWKFLRFFLIILRLIFLFIENSGKFQVIAINWKSERLFSAILLLFLSICENYIESIVCFRIFLFLWKIVNRFWKISKLIGSDKFADFLFARIWQRRLFRLENITKNRFSIFIFNRKNIPNYWSLTFIWWKSIFHKSVYLALLQTNNK